MLYKEGKIDLTEYSAEESERIIRAYFESQKKVDNE